MTSVSARDAAVRRGGLPPVLWRAGIPVLTGLVLALIPAPHGLAPYAWHYFAVFAAVILALITEPIPAAAVGLIGVTFAGVFGLAFSPAQMAGSRVQVSRRGAEVGARRVSPTARSG